MYFTLLENAVGGLVAVGLVGAVAIAMNTRSPKVADEPLTPPTTISSTPTQTPLEPQDSTEAPVQSKPRPRTSVSSQPRATIEQPDTPIPSQTRTPIIPEPEPTETPIASKAPEVPVYTPTPTRSPSPIIPKAEQPSPENFVQNYYQNINNGNLKSAWNQISPSLQANRKVHPKGYASYTEWWGGKVQQVQINRVRVVEANQNTATVDAQLNYQLRNGTQSPAAIRLNLVWDTNSNQWVISDAQRIRG